MFDKDMQKLYVYTKYLSKLLPKDNSDKVNLNDALLLEYYKLQKTAEGTITLQEQEGYLPPVSGGSAGNNKEKYGKTSTEYMRDLGVFGVPVILAHGIYLNDSDIEILKNIKGGISHNPISNCKLASGICDVVRLRNNGIKIGIGTDGTGSTSTLDMFEEMKVTAYLQKIKNMKPEIIKAYTILKMATIEGAEVLGLQNEIGTIEVGKKADIIIIDTDTLKFIPENDIATTLVYSLNGNDVLTTIIDGRVLMENRKFLYSDEEIIKENLRKNARDLLES